MKHWPMTLALLITTGNAWGIEALKLLRALPVAGPENLEPSGLAVCNDRLAMISDKHDGTVFTLRMEDNIAHVETLLSLPPIPEPAHGALPRLHLFKLWLVDFIRHTRFDWEGVSCDPAGNLYLLSETYAQILMVTPTQEVRWLDGGLYEAAHAKQMMQHTNGFAEGLAWAPEQLIIAAERDQRGLIELAVREGAAHVNAAQSIAPSGLPRPAGHKDTSAFSGLAYHNKKLYTLERSDSAVCRRSMGTFAIELCWSYAAVESAPEYIYKDAAFGQGEGLEISHNKLYVILDNNQQVRRAHPDDKRPLLFEFELP